MATRAELAKDKRIGDGEPLTKALKELEQCGFIRSYNNFSKRKNGKLFQVIDPYALFSQTYLEKRNVKSWLSYVGSPEYYSWCGYAFETVCLNHLPQIKRTLGISGIESNEYSWYSKDGDDGAQIDMLIDRRDDVVNLCEMKYTRDEYAIEAKYEKSLIHKAEVFRQQTKTKKTIHYTLVTASGLKRNKYSDIVNNVICGDDLFA